jgi:hypothetical protein
MAIWPHRHHTTAIRAAIALQVQARDIPMEKPRNITMPPNLVMAASQTCVGPGPWIILPLLINFLEKRGNKIYHVVE